MQFSRILISAIFWSTPLLGSQIDLGDVFYLSNSNGTTQFFLDNYTGPTDGCSTPNGFPVCTALSIGGTLSFSYFNGSSVVNGTATLSSPLSPDSTNAGASFFPSNFLVPSLNILSASFSGSLTPLSFLTDTGPFSSDGTVVSADVVAGGGFALLYSTSASSVGTPEPSSLSIAAIGCLALIYLVRRTQVS